MSIHELYESLTPAGFFAAAVGVFFFAGLFLGWCMWWWTARRHKQAVFDRSGVEGDVSRLKAENRGLELQLEQQASGTDEHGSKSELASIGDQGLAGRELSLVSVGGEAIDWASVDGIDPAMASELRSLGIKNFEQLERMSADDRAVLEAKLAEKGLQWDWNWLSGWKNPDGVSTAGISDVAKTAAGLAGVGLTGVGAGAAAFGAALSADDQKTNAELPRSEAGVHLPPTTAPEVDWSKVDGVDPKVAAELSQLGIKNVEQLEALSPEDREIVEAKLSFEGNTWNWGSLANWKTAAGAAAATAAVTTVAATSDLKSDLTDGATGTDGSSARSDEVTSLDGSPPGHANDGSSSGGATGDQSPRESVASDDSGSLGSTGNDVLKGDVVAGDVPAGNALMDSALVISDWGNIDDIDPAVARELSAHGIGSVGQLERLSSEDRHALEDRMARKGIAWDWSWLADWKSVVATSPGSDLAISPGADDATNELTDGGPMTTRIKGFAGVDGLSDDSSGTVSVGGTAHSFDPTQLPVFATGVPKVKDDLTLLDGIDGPQAIELHRMGIHNFDQLHDLSAIDRMRLQSWFRQRGWHLDMSQWRIASEGNTENPSMEDIQAKAFEVYQHRDYHNLCGGEQTDWEQAEWDLRGNPIYGYGVPHDVDDFTVTVTGITTQARDELYRMGLYNVHQVNLLDYEARRLLTRWFAGPRFGVDLTMAFGWLSSLESVPQDRNYGHVFASRPDQIDDLSDINGVGPATERDLNRIGIYQFSQVAAWTEENVEAISETLELGDRVTKDLWVTQAQRLTS